MGKERDLRTISFKLDVDTLLQLDMVAARERKYRSEVIRDAIKAYLLRLPAKEGHEG